MSKNKTQKGFTLIELLVVVAIISLLSSVVLGALNDARAKARDRALVQQVKQIQNALELYRGKYGEYPDGNSDQNSRRYYVSRLKKDNTWYAGSYFDGAPQQTESLTLEYKLREFIPEITAQYSNSNNTSYNTIFHYYSYYNGEVNPSGTYLKCTNDPDEGPYPPYVLIYILETNMSDSLPKTSSKVGVGGAWGNLLPNYNCLSVN